MDFSTLRGRGLVNNGEKTLIKQNRNVQGVSNNGSPIENRPSVSGKTMLVTKMTKRPALGEVSNTVKTNVATKSKQIQPLAQQQSKYQGVVGFKPTRKSLITPPTPSLNNLNPTGSSTNGRPGSSGLKESKLSFTNTQLQQTSTTKIEENEQNPLHHLDPEVTREIQDVLENCLVSNKDLYMTGLSETEIEGEFERQDDYENYPEIEQMHIPSFDYYYKPSPEEQDFMDNAIYGDIDHEVPNICDDLMLLPADEIECYPSDSNDEDIEICSTNGKIQ